MKKWHVITAILALLLLISVGTCSSNSAQVDRLKGQIDGIKAELDELGSSYEALQSKYNELRAASGILPEEPEPQPTPIARIGDTIANCGYGQNLSITLLWWKESDIVVRGPYSSGYYTFTAKPGMKFVLLAYEFQNNWIREQETPYLCAGEIVTAPKGYCYELWSPPVGVLSDEYNPRKAAAEEIETLIGDSGGYENLLPEESVVGCVVFEIPEDTRPVEANLVRLPYTISLEP